MTSIYLAGKISKGDWRYDLIGYRIGDVWDPPTPYGVESGGQSPEFVPWPVLKDAVLGVLDYAGPYYIENGGHGLGHGPMTHGCGLDGYGGNEPYAGRRTTIKACLDAIDRADIFFAWVDDITAYGTLTEIGYARAKGKPVVVGVPQMPGFSAFQPMYGDSADWSAHAMPEPTTELCELWFALGCGSIVVAASPEEAVKVVVDRIQHAGSATPPSV